MMIKTKSIYAYLLLSGVSYGQHTRVISQDSSANAAHLYASHSVKFDNGQSDFSDDSIVIPKEKPKYSQTFQESSSEDSLVTLVDETIQKNPEQACEVVKKAIAMSNAQESLICRVVETAILAAPDQIRLITQCAIASAPDCLTAIQLLVATYDASGASGSSGKEVSGKEVSGKEISGKEDFTEEEALAIRKAMRDFAEDAEEEFDKLDIMKRTDIGTPSASSPVRLTPFGGRPAPPVISPNPTTKTGTSNP